jgi:hypothetical protein
LYKYSDTFFERFNLSMRAAYESFIAAARKSSSDFPEDTGDEQIKPCLEDAYKRWLSEQIPGTGKTPCEYMDEAGFDDLIAMFSSGAVICDDDLPEIYLEKLLSYGDKAVDFLIETVSANTADENEQALIPAVMAARILGRQKIARAALPLIDILDKSCGVSELMQETARDALVNIGGAAVGLIIQEMDSADRSDETCEYLAMSLAEIGKGCRSDEIYSALKNAFNKLSDKAIAADCLARYGDGRAIPALRGYLIKNGEDLSRETFYDIVSAVRLLGGRTDDLKMPAKR